jgi:hypothetical protein
MVGSENVSLRRCSVTENSLNISVTDHTTVFVKTINCARRSLDDTALDSRNSPALFLSSIGSRAGRIICRLQRIQHKHPEQDGLASCGVLLHSIAERCRRRQSEHDHYWHCPPTSCSLIGSELEINKVPVAEKSKEDGAVKACVVAEGADCRPFPELRRARRMGDPPLH